MGRRNGSYLPAWRCALDDVPFLSPSSGHLWGLHFPPTPFTPSFLARSYLTLSQMKSGKVSSIGRVCATGDFFRQGDVTDIQGRGYGTKVKWDTKGIEQGPRSPDFVWDVPHVQELVAQTSVRLCCCSIGRYQSLATPMGGVRVLAFFLSPMDSRDRNTDSSTK